MRTISRPSTTLTPLIASTSKYSSTGGGLRLRRVEAEGGEWEASDSKSNFDFLLSRDPELRADD